MDRSPPRLQCAWSTVTDAVTVEDGRTRLTQGVEAVGRGRRDEAALHFARALDVLERIVDADTRRVELGTAGLLLDRAGFPDLALSALGEAVAIGERLGEGRALAEDLINLGGAYIHLGRSPEAERCLGRALAICERDGEWDDAASALTNLAIIVGNQGRMEDAIGMLKCAVAYCERRRGAPENEIVTRMATLQALTAVDREHAYAIEVAKPLLGRLADELRPDQRDNTVGPLRQCIQRYALRTGRDPDDIRREHLPGVEL